MTLQNLETPPSLEDEPAIVNVLDFDFYKLPMNFYQETYLPDVDATFAFINRDKDILPYADIVDEGDLRRDYDLAMQLRMGQYSDIYHLGGMDVYGDRLFPKSYLNKLRDFKLPQYKLERVGDQYQVQFPGKLVRTTFWELYCLPIMTHALHREVERHMSPEERREMYRRALKKLEAKLQLLKEHGGVYISEFGHRRRWSAWWHKRVITMMKDILGPQLLGTSNVHFARELDLVPMGTIAHEIFMISVALAERYRRVEAQYEPLGNWERLFPPALRIQLPDTYGSEQYYRNMPKDLAERVAHNWRGWRGDSGPLIEEGLLGVNWHKQFGVDPMTKKYIPSDGLDVGPILKIDDALKNVVGLSYGPGTNMVADFRGCHPRGNEQAVIRGKKLPLTWDDLVSPHSLVCKPISANGRPCVKLSNNLDKATAEDPQIVAEYKQDFGYTGTFHERPQV